MWSGTTNCWVILARRAADFPLLSARFTDAFSISFMALVLRLAKTGACGNKDKDITHFRRGEDPVRGCRDVAF